MGTTVRREGGTLGGASGEYVDGGGVRRVGGASHECVKKKTACSRCTQRPIQNQARKLRMTTTTMTPTTRRFLQLPWTASRYVLYRPCGAGRGIALKRCVITRIEHSHWAPATTRPDRHGRKRPYFTSGKTCPSCRIVSLRTPRYESPCTELQRLTEGRAGPACPLGHLRRAAVGADQCACFVRMPCGPGDPGCTACLYLVPAASGRRSERMSAVRGRYWWPWW